MILFAVSQHYAGLRASREVEVLEAFEINHVCEEEEEELTTPLLRFLFLRIHWFYSVFHYIKRIDSCPTRCTLATVASNLVRWVYAYG